MVGFGGWLMPVQYQGIVQEHRAVRTAAGLFDISHMGEVWVQGVRAEQFLNSVLTNDVSLLSPGQGQYTLMLNAEGGVIDDLLVYKVEPSRFLLVVNASMIEEDVCWLHSSATEGVEIENQSSQWAGFALQGPRSAGIASRLLLPGMGLPARNEIVRLSFPGSEVWLARTGYTGEDGFEWFCRAEAAAFWWEELLKSGVQDGLVPCGLGARDTLRLEMGFPLNGSDLSPQRSPLQAGLGAFVKFGKGDFVGRAALENEKARGIPFRLCGLVMRGKTPPPRAHYGVFHEGLQIGETTSGSLSPSLQCGIAMAYLPTALANPGTEVEINVRGSHFPAVVSKRPMYRPSAPPLSP
ncbi:MAG: hypothetical protein RLZZ399_508 [Verrucomicrobiota bacterium]